jgi:hypothetical protein
MKSNVLIVLIIIVFLYYRCKENNPVTTDKSINKVSPNPSHVWCHCIDSWMSIQPDRVRFADRVGRSQPMERQKFL